MEQKPTNGGVHHFLKAHDGKKGKVNPIDIMSLTFKEKENVLYYDTFYNDAEVIVTNKRYIAKYIAGVMIVPFNYVGITRIEIEQHPETEENFYVLHIYTSFGFAATIADSDRAKIEKLMRIINREVFFHDVPVRNSV